VEVRALRLWRFGIEEAARCVSDTALEDGMYFHKDAGIFTTSLCKPSAAEIEEWCDSAVVRGSTPSHASSAGGSVHCVVCRTASAAATGACKFCGADVATGIGAGDEADRATLLDDGSDVEEDAVAEASSGGSVVSCVRCGGIPPH
jgi:hypothetical protein